MRSTTRLVTILGATLALAACEGPMGPAGPAGPGTRLVLEATTNFFGSAVVILPPEAGTLASPPTVTCMMSEAGGFWYIVGLDTDGQQLIVYCIMGLTDEGDLAIGIEGAPPGWIFRAVIVY
jgi:hypothetical protein